MVGNLPLTISELRDALDRRAIASQEALAIQSDRVSVLHERYRCVTHVHPRAQTPVAFGPLAGVGLAHKDIFNTEKRYPSCGRFSVRAGRPSSGQAAALRRLERAGATNLAALTMAEYACGPTGENEPALQAVNPIDPELATGGSSSGSAVAVASGMAYASLGTDTAGSVRIPAMTCGVLGLKTGAGRVPTDGIFPLAPSLDAVGILARSVADVALLLAVLANRVDSHWMKAAATPYGIAEHLWHQEPARIGIAFDNGALDHEIAQPIERLIADISAKLHCRTASIADLASITRCAETVLHVEAAHVHWTRVRERQECLRQSTRAVLEPGFAIPALWYREALLRRRLYRRHLLETCFAGNDVVILPAHSQPLPDWSEVHSASPTFNAKRLVALYQWMPFANYLGLPAMVIPVGADSRGRPVSVQAVAKPGGEFTLLAFASRIERDCEGVGTYRLAIQDHPAPQNPSHCSPHA